MPLHLMPKLWRCPHGQVLSDHMLSQCDHSTWSRTSLLRLTPTSKRVARYFFAPKVAARAKTIFENSNVLKFCDGQPSLAMSTSISSSYKLIGYLSKGLLDSRTLLLWFQLASDVVVSLLRETKMINTSPFRMYRWNICSNSREYGPLTLVWISLLK